MGQQVLVERRPDTRQAWMADLLEGLPVGERPAVARALRILTAAAENLEAETQDRR